MLGLSEPDFLLLFSNHNTELQENLHENKFTDLGVFKNWNVGENFKHILIKKLSNKKA